jgi:NAD(P)H-dependent flavin oxidoreductase YrpB (nitropropane dioxygenase family)
VSSAGGLGILPAHLCPPPLFREQIRRARELTAKPFGVNLILHFPVEDHVAVWLGERIPVLSLFEGAPTPYVGGAHAAGMKVFHQVGSVGGAQRASAARVQRDLTGEYGDIAFAVRPGPPRCHSSCKLSEQRLRLA